MPAGIESGTIGLTWERATKICHLVVQKFSYKNILFTENIEFIKNIEDKSPISQFMTNNLKKKMIYLIFEPV